MSKMPDGIEVRHRKVCSKRRGGSNCTCAPTYRASVWDLEANRNRHSPSFDRKSDAVRWRADTLVAKHRKKLGPISSPKVDQVATEMFEAIQSGLLPTSSGSPYKPSTIRGYRLHYRNEIEPSVGSLKIDRLSRKHVQKLVDELAVEGSSSSVRNALMPLRLIVRFALQRDLIDANPFQAIQLPAKHEEPVQVLSMTEAKSVISTLSGRDQAVFATALFAGLRLGELRALRWKHIDFTNGIIRVETSWDRKEGEIQPKSRSSLRIVPLVPQLSEILTSLGPGSEDDFVLGSTSNPFGQQSFYNRTDKKLEPVGLAGTRLHPCRHFFASWLIESGATVKEVQVYMGHSTVEITLNRYSHLLGGNEARAAERFSAYLVSQDFSLDETALPAGT